MSERLAREIALQRALAFQDIGGQAVSMHVLDLKSFVSELSDFALHHPAGAGKKFHVACNSGRSTVKSDRSLLTRVISNMLVNALEATDPGDEILLRIDDEGVSVRFSVWNRGAIPEEVQLRIFQRYFSTKADSGRGIGTFVMKLFGEQFLGGKTGFTSSPADGTTFWLELPG
jgi:signal transduction histidine kinase